MEKYEKVIKDIVFAVEEEYLDIAKEDVNIVIEDDVIEMHNKNTNLLEFSVDPYRLIFDCKEWAIEHNLSLISFFDFSDKKWHCDIVNVIKEVEECVVGDNEVEVILLAIGTILKKDR